MKSDFPGMTRYPHRRFVYMELPPSGKLADGMSLIIQACVEIDSSGTAAVVEARATIQLPSGVELHGISFKTEHAVVPPAIDRVASETSLQFGEIDGDHLRLWDGTSVAIDDCVLRKY